MGNSSPHLGTLIALTAVSVLTLNMFLPALPAIQTHFGVSEAEIGLAISGYMAAAAILQIVLGPISDRFGRRPVALGLTTIYFVASVICLFAPNVTVFLMARVVQAVAVGGGVVAFAVVRDLFEGKAAAAKLATISSAMAIAPMLAPMLGGFMDAAFGWRSIFALYTVIGGGLLIAVLLDLKETGAARGQGDALPVSVLLKQRAFWAYAICMAFSVGTFFIFLTGAPFVAVAHFGLSSAQIGIGLGSITLGFMVGATISARTVERLGMVWLIFSGRFLTLGALVVGAIALAIAPLPAWSLLAFAILAGMGNGLSMPSANAAALSIEPRLSGTAAGMAGALSLGMGAALTAGTTAVLAGQAGPISLLLLMIAAALLSLVAAYAAWLWDQPDTGK